MRIHRWAYLAGAALSGLAISAAANDGRSATGSGQPELLTGGIGQASQQAMRQAAPQYGLGMTFATRSGQYVADVDVVIRDGQGRQVVDTTVDAPMMLVDLPPGRYTVQANYDGREQSRQVSVPQQGHRQLVMHW